MRWWREGPSEAARSAHCDELEKRVETLERALEEQQSIVTTRHLQVVDKNGQIRLQFTCDEEEPYPVYFFSVNDQKGETVMHMFACDEETCLTLWTNGVKQMLIGSVAADPVGEPLAGEPKRMTIARAIDPESENDHLPRWEDLAP